MKRLRLSPMRATFAGVLLLAVGLNWWSATSIEGNGAERLQAFQQIDQPDLDSLLFKTPKTQARYAPYYALARLAPGSEVVMAPVTEIPRERYANRLYGVGGVAEVTWDVDVDLEAVYALDLTPYIIASGPESNGGPSWFLAMEHAPTGIAPDDYVAALLAGEADAVAGEPRRFLLVEWPVERPDRTDSEDWTRQLALIDVALLPAGVIGE